jgi:hypothetical protein
MRRGPLAHRPTCVFVFLTALFGDIHTKETSWAPNAAAIQAGLELPYFRHRIRSAFSRKLERPQRLAEA